MNTTTAASKPGPAPTPEPSHAENEILIVGGGPGGLSTALHLHRIAPHLTPRILILEKGHYPRPKLCAGGLTLDAEVILERLGLDVNEVPHADAENIHFDFESKGLNVRVPKRHALRIVRRDEFDNWLADKTRSRGIEIREGITARNVIPDADGVTVETDQGIFRAQVVVGADGSNGVTRRCVFPHAPVYTARVLEVLTPSLSGRDGGGQGRGLGSAYFEFSPVPDNIAGYVWDFPTQVKGRAMRCWGIYDTNILADEKRPQLKEPLAQEMSRLGFDLNDYQIKGHPIRWFSPRNQMSAPHAGTHVAIRRAAFRVAVALSPYVPPPWRSLAHVQEPAPVRDRENIVRSFRPRNGIAQLAKQRHRNIAVVAGNGHRFTDCLPNNSFKPTPLRGAA